MVDNTKCIDFGMRVASRSGWRVIVLTRDPRGIAHSNILSGKRKGVPRGVLSKIPIFLDFARKANETLFKPNVLHIRYEDLCSFPMEILRKICEFLEIPFEPAMLNFKADVGHTLMGNRMRFDENQTIREDRSWVSELSHEEVSLITSNTNLTELYSRLGYEMS